MLPDINETADAMKRRMLIKRANALKEIEEWANKDTDIAGGGARAVGQIKENVTEERLLKSKLIDMSKKRHKFISSYHYQKVKFKESKEECLEMARQVRSQQSADDAKKIHGTGTKWLIHEQLNIDVDNADINKETPPDKKSKKMKELRVGRSKTFHGLPNANIGTADFKQSIGKRTETSHSLKFEPLPLIKTEINSKGVTVHFAPVHERYEHGNITRKVLNDPRYTKFEDLLCPVFITNCPFNIEQIVIKTESLRNPASLYEKSRTNILLKIQKYIKERGFTF